jgi:hypothetical protein
MGQSIANLLEFLATVFNADMDVWSSSSTEEEAIRSIARDYPLHRQRALLIELEALLAGKPDDAHLLEIALEARVNFVLEESRAREWFQMIHDQVRVVVAAAS